MKFRVRSFGAIPEYHSVHCAPDSRMNRMEGIRFTRNRQNTHSFGKCLAGSPTWPLAMFTDTQVRAQT